MGQSRVSAAAVGPDRGGSHGPGDLVALRDVNLLCAMRYNVVRLTGRRASARMAQHSGGPWSRPCC